MVNNPTGVNRKGSSPIEMNNKENNNKAMAKEKTKRKLNSYIVEDSVFLRLMIRYQLSQPIYLFTVSMNQMKFRLLHLLIA